MQGQQYIWPQRVIFAAMGVCKQIGQDPTSEPQILYLKKTFKSLYKSYTRLNVLSIDEVMLRV